MSEKLWVAYCERSDIDGDVLVAETAPQGAFVLALARRAPLQRAVVATTYLCPVDRRVIPPTGKPEIDIDPTHLKAWYRHLLHAQLEREVRAND